MAIRARKRDSNEPEIIEALQALGFSVAQLDGAGVPDLLASDGVNTYLIEVKNPAGRDRLTPAQRRFLDGWAGCPVIVIRNAADLAQLATTPQR